jgi:DNA repair exonuclease SbcCD ATPase subunit
VSKVKIETQVGEMAQILDALIRRKDQAQKRLLELSPVVSHFRHIEEQQCDLEKVKQEIGQFPSDLAQQLAECEQQGALLDEKAQAFPWLQSFVQARAGLASGLEQKQLIHRELEKLEMQHQQISQLHAQKRAEWVRADKTEKIWREQKILVDQKLKEAKQRLKRFREASLQPVCSLCGQPISPEHARAEIKALENNVETAKAASEQRSASYEEAHATQQRLSEECVKLTGQLTRIETGIQEQKVGQQAMQTRMEQDARHMRTAFANIGQAFQRSICGVMPTQDQDWLATQYPTQAYLEALQQEVGRRDAQKQRLEELRVQNQGRQKFVQRQILVEQQLRQLLALIDLDAARNACIEQETIQKSVESLTGDIEKQQQEQEQRKLLAQEMGKTSINLDTDLQACRTQLATARATRDTQDETLQRMISAFPSDWQKVATSLTTEDLNTFKQERRKLAPSKEQYRLLGLADQSREMYERRIRELQASLLAIPAEAQRPQIAVQHDLKQSKVVRDQCENESNKARLHLVSLRQQQAHYLDIERQKKEAERQYYLYSLLADLLGPGGLQLHLLRRAERIILELANQTLAGLSGHRLRLELRGEREEHAAPAEQALDLVVYDDETGQRAMLVNQVSGSQRFRIAVSLALAIGRSTRHEVRQIKSVIIDEGFGSLDKTGSDDMRRELTALAQELELERIILVSHQDEFAIAFPNRYNFCLVEKASRVTLSTEE